MPNRPSRRADRRQHRRRTGRIPGLSASLSFLITSRARSRDSTSCTWLVTASGSTVAVAPALFGFGAQENVFAGFEQHPRFGAVARRDQIDDDEGDAGGANVRPRSTASCATATGRAAEIEFADRLRNAKATRQWRTDLHNALHKYARNTRFEPHYKGLRLMAR